MNSFDINFNSYKYNESVIKKLSSICTSILGKTEISTLSYFRFYKDNRYVFLCNHMTWLEFYLKKYKHNDTLLGREIKNVMVGQYHFFLWPEDRSDELLKDMYKFNICNGLSVFKRSGDYVESWEFASQKGVRAANFYANNLPFITNAIKNFNFQAETIIKDAEKYARATYCEAKHGAVFDESQILANEIKEFLKLTQVKNIPVMVNGREVFCSKRQEECLYLLSQGHTCKNAAIHLNLSNKTIEYYINNIRKKFQLKTKSDILEAYSRSKSNWLTFSYSGGERLFFKDMFKDAYSY